MKKETILELLAGMPFNRASELTNSLASSESGYYSQDKFGYFEISDDTKADYLPHEWVELANLKNSVSIGVEGCGDQLESHLYNLERWAGFADAPEQLIKKETDV